MDLHHALPAVSIGISVVYKLAISGSGPWVPCLFLLCGFGSSWWLHKNIPRNVLLKPLGNGNPGFGIGTLRVKGDVSASRPPFTVFYPAEQPPTDKKANLDGQWLPDGDMRYAAGVARYASLPPYLFRTFSTHKIGAMPNVPIVAAEQVGAAVGGSSSTRASEYDIILVSHGLAGHQGMYSTFCMELVAQSVAKARPAVVIALQHTDGSSSFAPISIGDPTDEVDFSPPGSPTQQMSPGMKLDATGGLYYQKEPKDGLQGLKFRAQQMDIRQLELVSVLQYVKTGQLTSRLATAGGGSKSPISASPRIHLIGHSFGAVGVVWSILDAQVRSSFNIQSVCAFDPWMHPLHQKILELKEGIEKKGASSSSPPLPPLRIFDSDQWEKWKGNLKEEATLQAYWNLERKNEAFAKQVERHHTPKTDHVSLSDIVFFAVTASKKYTDRSKLRSTIRDWAGSALDFQDECKSAVEQVPVKK